jgi:hypothetical protein
MSILDGFRQSVVAAVGRLSGVSFWSGFHLFHWKWSVAHPEEFFQIVGPTNVVLWIAKPVSLSKRQSRSRGSNYQKSYAQEKWCSGGARVVIAIS